MKHSHESRTNSIAAARFSLLATLILFSLLLTACTSENEGAQSSSDDAKRETVASRWYTADNVSRGAVVFQEQCASCHGKEGQGSVVWRQVGADGKFPPPPLNGTGHAWHHPFRVLGSQIKFGAPGGQGSMPGMAEILSDQDIVDVIAWFQSKWSDEIYAAWLAREQQSRADTN